MGLCGLPENNTERSVKKDPEAPCERADVRILSIFYFFS